LADEWFFGIFLLGRMKREILSSMSSWFLPDKPKRLKNAIQIT
jgi:hypothetical protein